MHGARLRRPQRPSGSLLELSVCAVPSLPELCLPGPSADASLSPDLLLSPQDCPTCLDAHTCLTILNGPPPQGCGDPGAVACLPLLLGIWLHGALVLKTVHPEFQSRAFLAGGKLPAVLLLWLPVAGHPANSPAGEGGRDPQGPFHQMPLSPPGAWAGPGRVTWLKSGPGGAGGSPGPGVRQMGLLEVGVPGVEQAVPEGVTGTCSGPAQAARDRPRPATGRGHGGTGAVTWVTRFHVMPGARLSRGNHWCLPWGSGAVGCVHPEVSPPPGSVGQESPVGCREPGS